MNVKNILTSLKSTLGLVSELNHTWISNTFVKNFQIILIHPQELLTQKLNTNPVYFGTQKVPNLSIKLCKVF